jgi:hypothetical protein
VDPPAALEKDPDYAKLGQPLQTEAWRADKAPLLAVGPIAMSYARPREALYGDIGPDGAPIASASLLAKRRELEADLPNTWWDPPINKGELQARIANLVRWSLYDGTAEVPKLAELGTDLESVPPRRAALCELSDRARAPLVLHVDLVENRISWVRRDGLIWWLDFGLLWGGGIVPMVLVPDEVYEASVTARVTVVHARSGEVIFQQLCTGSYSQSLNNPQRGWSLSALLGLHDFFLSPGDGDYGKAYEALRPFAFKALEASIVAALRQSLPEQVDRHRTIIREGTEASSRVYAIVVGHCGPGAVKPRPPLRYAEKDAESVAEVLRRAAARPDHVQLLTGDHATKKQILEKLADFAPQLLKLDRLVFYFSGYGRTDGNGTPTLVLDDGDLSVDELSRAFTKELVEKGRNRPAVVFLLDTSFGTESRGRNYRGQDDTQARAPEASTFLDALGNKDLGWCVIAAAEPREAAFEIDARTKAAEHGYFTQRLISGLEGDADTTQDGAVTTEELITYLRERVPEDARPAVDAEQVPIRRGTQTALVLTRVR